MRTIQEADRAANNLPVTQAEAEAVVRSVTRVCRGLPVLEPEKQKEFQAAWNSAFAVGDWSASCWVADAAEKAVGIVGAQVDAGDWENLWRRAATAIYAHGDTVGKPCGYDFNDIICSFPFDGAPRIGKCPKCGNE